MTNAKRLGLQAVYTIPELADAAGLTTRRMRRELKLVGVSVRRSPGQKTGRIFLSDLLSLAPDLAYSLAARCALAESAQSAMKQGDSED